jgi:HK97 family phage major capsid protein
MKKSLDLKETRSDLVSKLEDLHSVATTAKRELTKNEGKKVDTLIADIDALDVSIKRSEKMEKELRVGAAVSGGSISTPKADKRYSIQNAIQGMVNGNLSGLEKEYDQEAKRNNKITGLGVPTFAFGETRNNPQVTSNASGMIPTEVGAWAETLQNKTVLGDLATWMYGLSGDMKLPTLSGTTAGWTAESTAAAVTTATDAATAIGSTTLQPKQLDAYMDISKMLLAQTNSSVENIIRQDMNNAIASTLEAAVLGDNAGAAATPQGVFNAGTGTAAGAASYAGILALQEALETSNADFGRVAYLTTPGGRTLLKNVIGQPLAGAVANGYTNGQPIWSDDLIDGYMARSTGNVDVVAGGAPDQGLVLGRWDDCVIGQFGTALDVVVDPYTLALNGQVRIVIMSYWDTVFRRAESFQYTYI